MRTLLIDGDAVAWNIAYHPERVYERTVSWVVRQLRDLEATRALIALSDGTGKYFRHEIFPGYKPNRSPRPPQIEDAYNALRAEFEYRAVPGLEADDVLGILGTSPTLRGERVILSRDKDLRSVPGFHYNPFQKDPPPNVVRITAREADYNHLYQTLVGEGSGDGYKGCPGVGPKKVLGILYGEPVLWWKQVVLAFLRAGQAEEDALLQARLARIVRSTEYDYATRKVIPWTPDRIGFVPPVAGPPPASVAEPRPRVRVRPVGRPEPTYQQTGLFS